ncbi:hypothetical protein ON010_g12344 [Phytophthora cinnamomi]|nr:hypothetical protein ON010_g12344 [Phytophthora cinnamomi]
MIVLATLSVSDGATNFAARAPVSPHNRTRTGGFFNGGGPAPGGRGGVAEVGRRRGRRAGRGQPVLAVLRHAAAPAEHAAGPRAHGHVRARHAGQPVRLPRQGGAGRGYGLGHPGLLRRQGRRAQGRAHHGHPGQNGGGGAARAGGRGGVRAHGLLPRARAHARDLRGGWQEVAAAGARLQDVPVHRHHVRGALLGRRHLPGADGQGGLLAAAGLLRGQPLGVCGLEAMDNHFSQPVVGYFPPEILLSSRPAEHVLDFADVTKEQLDTFDFPFHFVVERTAIMHGLGCWFTVDFLGSDARVVLSTAPHDAGTHWYQCRLLLTTPVAVNASQSVSGNLHFVANKKFSYDIDIEGALWLLYLTWNREIAAGCYRALPQTSMMWSIAFLTQGSKAALEAAAAVFCVLGELPLAI